MKRGERRRLSRMHKFEQDLWDAGARFICGVDEVGRGPLAGPVTACAVIIDKPMLLEFLNDSKVVTELRRVELDARIRESAVAVSLGWAGPEEIDAVNILRASHFAMHRAIAGLGLAPCRVLVDGYPLPDCMYPQDSIIDGDAKSAAIAAASIVAKVARDALMVSLDERYPGYGFAQHKGYCTAEHVAAIAKLGPSPVHRKSFAHVAQTFLDLSIADPIS
jgi:ribonuclease HII